MAYPGIQRGGAKVRPDTKIGGGGGGGGALSVAGPIRKGGGGGGGGGGMGVGAYPECAGGGC